MHPNASVDMPLSVKSKELRDLKIRFLAHRLDGDYSLNTRPRDI